MAAFFDTITPDLDAFIRRQQMYFVATAPLSDTGRVNLSPKGLDSFRILSPNCVAYLDLTGSGNETSAHLAENGRITFMFCAFEEPPRILRLYGTGRTVLPGGTEWEDYADHFTLLPGTRQIVVADITQVQTSCGFAVPLMEYVAQRDTLTKWAKKVGPERLATYRQQKNAQSIDGLPAPLATSNVSA